MNGIVQDKTWFSIDGTLEPVEFDGPNYFRFPISLAEIVLDKFCPKNGSVFDPFAGFGTTLVAAQSSGRFGVGFEYDVKRADFAKSRIQPPCKLIHDDIKNVCKYDLPQFDLIFTSPPYASFSGPENDPMEKYLPDFERIFLSFKPLLRPEGHLVIEISNVKDDRGNVPLAFLATQSLLKHYIFMGELVRCNTSDSLAGPGYNHSYLLVFKNG